ncbi:hypothetical protein TARUN_1705 [Trichoderma arundinaceum]|uniref:Uncharacterized protein n=1 Tax=Trichoderma arundinaceum TaxID=490622 RepID=A0A395NWS1_TRIAR|nr:hypothetical protein TARUN_1705 [Trichoderma arundinaceum]
MHYNTEYIVSYLGHERHYHSFVDFFQQEIAATVLNEYLFSRSHLTDDLLARMYVGYSHPLIHLGFGIEFEQPVLVAEALTQGAVHPDWMKRFLLGAEKAAKTKGNPSKTLIDLLSDINMDPFLSMASSLRDSDGLMDGNKLQYGILGRGAEAAIDLSSQFMISVENLDQKTAEMIGAAA